MEENKQDQVVQELSKEDKFKANPDEFIHVSDLVMAIKKHDENNFGVLLNTYKPSEIGGMLFMLFRHCLKMLDAIELRKHMESEQTKKIVTETNKRNFNNFLRKR